MRKRVEGVMIRALEKELGRLPTVKELKDAMKQVEGSLMFPEYGQPKELGEMIKSVGRLEKQVEVYKREINRLKKEINFFKLLEGC